MDGEYLCDMICKTIDEIEEGDGIVLNLAGDNDSMCRSCFHVFFECMRAARVQNFCWVATKVVLLAGFATVLKRCFEAKKWTNIQFLIEFENSNAYRSPGWYKSHIFVVEKF